MSSYSICVLLLTSLQTCSVEAVVSKQSLKRGRLPNGAVQVDKARASVLEAQHILESFAFEAYKLVVENEKVGPERLFIYRAKCALDAQSEADANSKPIQNLLVTLFTKAAGHYLSLQGQPTDVCEGTETEIAKCRLFAAEAMVALAARENCETSKMTESLDIAKDAVTHIAQERLSTAFQLLNSTKPAEVALNMSTPLQLIDSLSCRQNEETTLCQDKPDSLKEFHVVNAALEAANAIQVVRQLKLSTGVTSPIRHWTTQRLTRSFKPCSCNASNGKFVTSSKHLGIGHAHKMRNHLGFQESNDNIVDLGATSLREDVDMAEGFTSLLKLPLNAFALTSTASVHQKVNALHEYFQAAACMSNAVAPCATCFGASVSIK